MHVKDQITCRHAHETRQSARQATSSSCTCEKWPPFCQQANRRRPVPTHLHSTAQHSTAQHSTTQPTTSGEERGKAAINTPGRPTQCCVCAQCAPLTTLHPAATTATTQHCRRPQHSCTAAALPLGDNAAPPGRPTEQRGTTLCVRRHGGTHRPPGTWPVQGDSAE